MNQVLKDSFDRLPRISLTQFDDIWEHKNTKMEFLARAEDLMIDSAYYCGLVREGTEYGEAD